MTDVRSIAWNTSTQSWKRSDQTEPCKSGERYRMPRFGSGRAIRHGRSVWWITKNVPNGPPSRESGRPRRNRPRLSKEGLCVDLMLLLHQTPDSYTFGQDVGLKITSLACSFGSASIPSVNSTAQRCTSSSMQGRWKAREARHETPHTLSLAKCYVVSGLSRTRAGHDVHAHPRSDATVTRGTSRSRCSWSPSTICTSWVRPSLRSGIEAALTVKPSTVALTTPRLRRVGLDTVIS
jgi:hypothetical protein